MIVFCYEPRKKILASFSQVFDQEIFKCSSTLGDCKCARKLTDCIAPILWPFSVASEVTTNNCALCGIKYRLPRPGSCAVHRCLMWHTEILCIHDFM